MIHICIAFLFVCFFFGSSDVSNYRAGLPWCSPFGLQTQGILVTGLQQANKNKVTFQAINQSVDDYKSNCVDVHNIDS